MHRCRGCGNAAALVFTISDVIEPGDEDLVDLCEPCGDAVIEEINEREDAKTVAANYDLILDIIRGGKVQ